MLPRIALILSLAWTPAFAQEANLLPSLDGATGAASQLVLAQRVYRHAGKSGDPVLLLAAIRLARGVTIRAAPAWERTTDATDPPPDREWDGPPDPGDPAALAVLQGLVLDDPDLQDLAFDLDAQLPKGRLPVATVAKAGLNGGSVDDWRLALSGAVAAEIAVIGDGGTALAMSVVDEGGTVVCAHPATTEPALCRFTPARNGFFIVRVTNEGASWNSYHLVGN
jgi:hypothetical protein